MKAPKDIEKYAKYFSEAKLGEKLLHCAKRLGVKVVYYALVLYYALMGKSVSGRDRAIILGALGYLILPIDLIPDFIPVLGFTDDAAALTLAVFKVIRNITPEVKERAQNRVRELFGDEPNITFPDLETPDPDIDEQ